MISKIRMHSPMQHSSKFEIQLYTAKAYHPLEVDLHVSLMDGAIVMNNPMHG
jgi:hypothetical protein